MCAIVLGTSAGELAVARAMKRVGEIRTIALGAAIAFLRGAVREKWFWIGIGFLALGFFSLLALLSWKDVSFVIPASAFSYVTGALGAKIWLHEDISLSRWAGILLVSLGVALVSFSG